MGQILERHDLAARSLIKFMISMGWWWTSWPTLILDMHALLPYQTHSNQLSSVTEIVFFDNQRDSFSQKAISSFSNNSSNNNNNNNNEKRQKKKLLLFHWLLQIRNISVSETGYTKNIQWCLAWLLRGWALITALWNMALDHPVTSQLDFSGNRTFHL